MVQPKAGGVDEHCHEGLYFVEHGYLPDGFIKTVHQCLTGLPLLPVIVNLAMFFQPLI